MDELVDQFGSLEFALEEELAEWGDFPVTIGITGESGCGKSTFINTMRGLDAEDPNAAEVGVIECTTEPTPYVHPSHPGDDFSLPNSLHYM